MKKRGGGEGRQKEQKEKREQENSFEVATLGRRREVFPLGRAHVRMTTTTYDAAAAADDDDGDNGKKLEESKPTVGGVDRGAFPRATSRKVARRAFQSRGNTRAPTRRGESDKARRMRGSETRRGMENR